MITFKHVKTVFKLINLKFNCYSVSSCVAETVAVIGFVGYYICDPAAGYQCETHDKRTFFVITPCQPGGNFALLADGELLTPCIGTLSYVVMRETMFWPSFSRYHFLLPWQLKNNKFTCSLKKPFTLWCVQCLNC